MGPPLRLDILILEDDGLVRQGLIETLEHAGYRAIGAVNGRGGVARVAGVRPRPSCPPPAGDPRLGVRWMGGEPIPWASWASCRSRSTRRRWSSWSASCS